MRSKKAINTPGLLVLVTVICIGTFAAYSFTRFSAFEKEIGENQVNLLAAKYKANERAFYIEQAAKNALLQANQDQLDSGALLRPRCGTLEGYNVWDQGQEGCTPDQESIQDDLLQITKTIFIENLKETPYKGLAESFVFYVGEEFVGSTSKTLDIDQNKDLIYSIHPSFIAPTYQTFSYEAFLVSFTKSKIISQIESCEKEGEEIRACAASLVSTISTPEFTWEINCDNKVTLDQIDQTRQIPFCVTDNTKKVLLPGKRENPVLKFALFIPLKAQSVNAVDVIHPQGTDSQIILSWSMPTKNIKQFNIYLTDFDLENQRIQDGTIKQGEKEATKISLPLSPLNKIDTTTNKPGICTYESLNTCTPKIPLDENTLYQDQDDIFYVLISIDKQTDLTISTMDTAETESSSISLIKKIRTEDKVPPEIVDFQPVYNAVTSKLEINKKNNPDAVSYLYFLANTCIDLIPLDNPRTNRVREDDLDLLVSGEGTFCLGIIALDKDENPITQTEDNREIYLSVKEEFKPIINQLANPQTFTVP